MAPQRRAPDLYRIGDIEGVFIDCYLGPFGLLTAIILRHLIVRDYLGGGGAILNPKLPLTKSSTLFCRTRKTCIAERQLQPWKEEGTRKLSQATSPQLLSLRLLGSLLGSPGGAHAHRLSAQVLACVLRVK